MRKIISEHDENKKKKRNQIILGIFLVLTMFISVIGYSFQTNVRQNTNQGNQTKTQSINYNGFNFVGQNGFWLLSKDSGSFIFRYNPQQIIGTNVSINPQITYDNKILYINSADFSAESEIRANLAQFAGGIENACLGKCNETQIKTCNDNFIIIKEANESKISTDKNCVFIEGNAEDLVKLTDEFLFKFLGIN